MSYLEKYAAPFNLNMLPIQSNIKLRCIKSGKADVHLAIVCCRAALFRRVEIKDFNLSRILVYKRFFCHSSKF